eukprot:scaffold84360_cov47-Attheya_sp.AAC.5
MVSLSILAALLLNAPLAQAWITTSSSSRHSRNVAIQSALSDVNDNVDESASPSLSSSSRRDFMASTVSTVASTVAATTIASSGLMLPKIASAAVESATLKSPLVLPPLGLGAWAWGDSLFWGYDPKQDSELKEVFDYAVQQQTTALFDTAEVYGFGRSETLLGQFRSPETSEKIQIATKFAAYPFRTKPSDVVKACEASVKRLGGEPIDLYQVHFPNAWSNAEYWEGLADAYDMGLVKAVGVSNYGADATRAAHAALAKRGIPLSTNQIQLSLLYKWPLENGLLDVCNELGVKVLAYSPLALGFLTGKYSATNLPTAARKSLGKKLFDTSNGEDAAALTKLLDTMGIIAAAHGPE